MIILLSELSKVPECNKINCEDQVLQIDEPVCTSNGKTVQNVIVADRNGITKIKFLEDNVENGFIG